MFQQRDSIEKGIIKYVYGNRAGVEIINPDSTNCKSCGICVGIETGQNLLEVDAVPHISVGQQVTVQISENSPYKSMILIFILPILSLLTGSILGQKIRFLYPGSENLRMICFSLIFFLLYIASISLYDKKMRSQKHLHRKIISIDAP
ncbi:MAG: SoxR reducing system RseC family protein [Candidatus Loosdrechtia sp.]|uniref:SoxR reducing system RseC family protein n=1 Tax=Candidatus Loosdrechtia sp. TaxID=3101272 RepID=UPI003A64D076|nr:MAG: SoxR reducing system RseC family protein [Candidatus Jettenia sp. AMX2]